MLVWLFVVGIVAVLLWMNWQLGLLVLCITPVLAVLCVLSAAHFAPAAPQCARPTAASPPPSTGHYGRGNHQDAGARRGQAAKSFTPLRAPCAAPACAPLCGARCFFPLVSLGSISTALALVRGGNLVFAAVLDFGTLAAFLSYTTQLFDPIQQLANILAEMQAAQASAERVIDLLDTKPDIVDTPR